MRKKLHPLKWHGGKYYLAKWIVSQMEDHIHYVEPYFGGGSVLFARDPTKDWSGKGKGCSEIINDIHGDLMNFYQVLADKELFNEFLLAVSLRPFSEFVFEEAKCILAQTDVPPVKRATAFFMIMRMGRQGLGKDFSTVSRNRTRGRINEQVNAYLTAVSELPEVHERLQTVLMLSRCALDVIRQQDGGDTLFYLDPPYLHETRSVTGSYLYEMELTDHEDLLIILSDLKGKFLLSGYANSLYETHARENGWNCSYFRIPNHASSQSKKPVKVECLWRNYGQHSQRND